MSNRPAVKSPFANLRPSIIREPVRSTIAPEDEIKLLEKTAPTEEGNMPPTPESLVHPVPAAAPPQPFQTSTLLTKKRREVLVPVTFRIPQTLKEHLNEIAKRHEINQTDLINEAIQLNLQRYS